MISAHEEFCFSPPMQSQKVTNRNYNEQVCLKIHIQTEQNNLPDS